MRRVIELNDTEVVRGYDRAIGAFIQVADRRYAGSPDDEQGEGYVMEWDQVFGFGTNLIGATLLDLQSNDKLVQRTENWIKSKGYGT